MTKKHMKRCSPSYVIRKMQIKTMMICHYAPGIRMTQIQTPTMPNAGGCGGTGALIHCWSEYKMAQPLWKTFGELLRKLNLLSLHSPSVRFLDVYPKEFKIYGHTETCTQIFMAAFFILAITRKQQRCLQ